MARFTPVTTATSAWPLATRIAVVRHDPPGRSTNSTAGRPPIARASRSVSAPVSQPSFDTASSASATPACDTTTPRTGSLIVLFEVLLQRPALGQPLEQPLVERARRVHP